MMEQKYDNGYCLFQELLYLCIRKGYLTAQQIAEIRTVAKSLPLFLKYSAKSLLLNRLWQTDENLKVKSYIHR